MPTRKATRLSTMLTGTRRLNTGFQYPVDSLNFHDPKSLKTFKQLLTKSAETNNEAGTSNAQTHEHEPIQDRISLDEEEKHIKNNHSIRPVSSYSGSEEEELRSFYHALKTDPKRGLSYDDINDKELYRNRTYQYGKNVLPITPPKPLWKLIFEAMQDKVLILLSVAAVVSLALGLYETFGQDAEYDPEGKKKPKVEWVEGVAIIVAIIIVVVVGSVNDYQKERQFAKLNAKKEDKKVITIREGKETVVSIYDLLVGDVVQVQTGDILPADGVMISGECECDESALTGETNSIKKFEISRAYKEYNQLISTANNADADISTNDEVLDPFFISGSKVLSGFGTFMVTAVGENSIHGRTMASLKVEPEVTPLQARLEGLANGISKFGLIAALILFIVLFIRFCALLPAPHRYSKLTGAAKGEQFLNIVIVAITIVVVAVPEGLPLAVTLALAFATTRMASDNNLVRVLKSCETMGGATAICSDKTGTLTENRMRIVKGSFGDDLEFNDTTGVDDDSESTNSAPVKSSQVKENVTKTLSHHFLVNSVLNSAAFENNEEEDDSIPEIPKKKHFWSKSQMVPVKQTPEPFTGSKTEIALLILCSNVFGMTGDRSLPELRNNLGLLDVDEIVQVIPFESLRKWSGVVVRNSGTNTYTLYIKGAAEIVARKASHIYNNSSGSSKRLDEGTLRADLNNKIESYAKSALRSICLAHFELSEKFRPSPDFDGDEFFAQLSSDSNGLIIDSIVGIQDPLREGVADAVSACQIAGVTVRMVTGDNLLTGKSIALGCGIIKPAEVDQENICMEGPVFRKLSTPEMRKIIPGLRVLARSSPEDKRILVQNLKEMGEVVAVTGDGTNDAPALKLANVGFSMGISGTDVAREASDIILMTDNFSAIVQAIKWGRCVAISIKKFIQFQLTVNVTAVVLTFVSAVASSSGKSVLTAVQLLWVNLIMDTLAALALATDKPDDDILRTKPAGSNTPLISVAMWKMIFGQSITQLVITFVLHFAGKQIFFHDKKFTSHNQTQLDAMTFNTFVWLQFFSMFVARKLNEGDGITKVKDRISKRNLNFFSHLFRNWYFIAIMAIIGGFQVLIMFVGGAAFSVARQTGAMWGTAIICGLVSLPIGALIRIVPDTWVVKIFPFTAWNWILYIMTFEFLRKSKKSPSQKKKEQRQQDIYADGTTSERTEEGDLNKNTIPPTNNSKNQSRFSGAAKGKDESPSEDSTTLTESASGQSAQRAV